MMKQSLLIIAILVVLQIVGGQDCCDVQEFSTDSKAADGTWTVAATMWSPYESAEGASFCDLVEIRSVTSAGGNYTVLGERAFNQSHPDEQPFLRMVGGIALASGEDTIVAIARDSVNGFCGESLTLTITGDMPITVTAPPVAPSITPPPAPVSTAPVVSAPVSPAPVVDTSTTSPVAAQGGMGGGGNAPVALSTLPSVMPSYLPSGIPSYLPSSIPSDASSTVGKPTGGGTSGARAAFGFSAVAAVAATTGVSMFLL